MLFAQDPCHEFWATRFGGIEAKNALNHANIPVLLTTGYNDFYIGGVFQMWRELNEEMRRQSALLISPYNHGDGYDPTYGLAFENGKRSEAFGAYAIDWIENIQKGTPLPFETGVITYYRAFEKGWASDFEAIETQDLKMPLGEEIRSFVYDPLQPPAFACEGLFAEEGERAGVLTIFTPPMEKDIFIKGKMRATLKVASDCPDTSFYMRVSIQKGERAYVLRHDITSLCYQLGEYQENEMVDLQFTFDEYAFLLKQGESLRIDIASTDDNSYVCHTNQKGEYAMQTETRTAINTVDLKESYLILPVEKE
jgi:predicted acyl esterase